MTRDLRPDGTLVLTAADIDAAAQRAVLTAERLRELLHYDLETGVFVWKSSPRQGWAGHIAGSPADGYVSIQIDGHRYRAHRLAWLYMTGEWPANEIDHVDLRRDNNRWTNLRCATKAENRRNRVVRCDNTSGFKGVSPEPRNGKWRVRIRIEGKRLFLGEYDTREAAAAVYAEAAQRLHGEFARTS